MISKDVNRLRFVLASSGVSTRARLEEARDAYSIFILLEQQEVLGRNNVKFLHDALQELESKDLHMKYINQYIGMYRYKHTMNRSKSNPPVNMYCINSLWNDGGSMCNVSHL